jgi:hypothetical protein
MAVKLEAETTRQQPILLWERRGRSFFARTENPRGDVELFLIVDRLPDQAWNWGVWQPGAPEEMPYHGTACTVQEAMQAAELAAHTGLE